MYIIWLHSGAKNALYIIDISTETIKYKFDINGYGQEIVSVAWNSDGSQLAAVNKKGTVAVGNVPNRP